MSAYLYLTYVCKIVLPIYVYQQYNYRLKQVRYIIVAFLQTLV